MQLRMLLSHKTTDVRFISFLSPFEDSRHMRLCEMKFRVRLRLKCDGTRAETRFRLSAKRASPFKSAGASIQSTTGSRVVRISGSNARCTMFRGSVKSTGYLTPFGSFPFTSPPVHHRVPSHFNWTRILPCFVAYDEVQKYMRRRRCSARAF
jgi:hypothetical protein